MFVLVVTQPFGARAIGDEITDADEIAATLEINPGSVVRRAATPDQVAKPTKADKA